MTIRRQDKEMADESGRRTDVADRPFARGASVGEEQEGVFKMAGKKIEGKMEQVKGRVQVALGKVTGKRSTQLKGKVQQAKGKIKEELG